MRFIDDKVSVLCGVLKEHMNNKICDLDSFVYGPCDYKTDNTVPHDITTPFVPHSTLGGKDKHYWFITNIRTPAKKENHELYFELITGKEGQWDATNPQGILYLNGKMYQGLDVNHTRALLEYDTDYELAVYFYLGMTGEYLMFEPSLVETDKVIEKVYYDLSVPLDACKVLDPKSNTYIQSLKQLELAVGYLDMREPFSEAYYKGIEACEKHLEENYYGGLCGASDASVSCIGHTHIDVAWLWTLAQTREKAQRSFSTVLALMKQYPEYIFMSSQPQLYKYVKQESPELYEEIKKAVKEGRWETEGAMWLEADCNLSSGESLVRQILHGKRFMKEELGVDSRVLWLPDVFGYSIALPQILKKSGIDKFVTSKISWNETNKMPVDSFMWQGIDGTEIFTFFITARDHSDPGKDDNYTTYVGYIRPSQVLGTWERYQQKHYNNETLITFGFGDGGGGPTKDMLEQQRRLSYGLPGFPKTKIEKAGDFLDRIEKKFEENCSLLKRTPKWVGELYLEYHRGTYTSIAKNKKNNRKSELLFQEVEKLSCTDLVLNGGAYPHKDIYDSWETILLNQFHDIIPGSSIFEVYEECDRQYAQIRSLGEDIRAKKLTSIASEITSDGGLMVYNPHSFAAGGTVDLDGKKMFVGNVPPLGWKVVVPEAQAETVILGDSEMENDFFKVVFGTDGGINSIYDKRYGREALAKGEKGNRLEAFEDLPRAHDNWELSSYYKQKMWVIDDVVSFIPLREGARSGFEITRNFLKSTIRQRIWLYNDIAKIDFETYIDWKQEHIVLKAAFPAAVHTDHATYDIQFGNVERPTHMNTSWDAAKFEVCAHKWADISDGGYGISLLNDCKYGYSSEGNVLKLTLLKCGTYPNPHADKGIHEFTYSLVPHAGSFKDSGTIQESYLLNMPLSAVPVKAAVGTLPAEYSLAECSRSNIIIETIKKAEDSDSVVMRMYEDANMLTPVEIKLGFKAKKAYICDLMENDLEEIAINNDTVSLTVGNFEIVSLRLEF